MSPSPPPASGTLWRPRLRAAGLRVTDARLDVLGALEAAQGPLTHDAVAACTAGRGIDRATVYRNLVGLMRAGLVARQLGHDRSWRYALTQPARSQPGPHPHFSCKDCGESQCLPALDVALHGQASRLTDGDAEIEVVLRGHCGACRPS